jgi:tryptophan synthase alpha chain
VLSVFLPIGWPTPEAFLELCRVAVDSGAGALELGIPFSDPVADGPVLQAANREVLARGARVADAIELLARIGPAVPRNLLVYGNLVHARPGFVAEVRAAGADSLLVPDVPLEEWGAIRRDCRAHGVGFVGLVGPRTDRARLHRIAEEVTAYLYVAAVQGITGAAADPAVETVRRAAGTGRPAYAGFGIRHRAQVEACLEAGASSVIVGSALVEVGREPRVFAERVRGLAG